MDQMIIRQCNPRYDVDPYDWTWGVPNGAGFLQNDSAIAEAINLALQLFRGEVFWYTNYGIDWWNILGGVGAQVLMNTLVVQAREVILGISGVTSVTEISANVNSQRQVTIQYDVTTINGSSITNFTVTPYLPVVGPLYGTPVPTS